MTRAAMLLASVLALCGCGARQAGPPEDPNVAACRAETRNDPAVREVFRRQPPGDDGWWLQNEIRTVQRPLIRACLENKGVARFGVQPRDPR